MESGELRPCGPSGARKNDTMEDVLEEIVGEIEDEFSRTRESAIVRLSEGAALVDAGITTENVEEMFGTRIETTDVDTVGGLVYHSLGKIPQVGDVVETDHLRIEVGREFGVTRERIRQIEAKALRKLRHPTRSRKLKDFLE